jgi:hypothetical protein
VSKILVVAQVRVLLATELLMLVVGADRSWVMTWLALLVHPLVPVAVTVYVPGVVTLIEAVVPTTLVPLLQE